MHSPRAQADKKAYQIEVKHRIESQINIDLRQELVEDLLYEQVESGFRVLGSWCGAEPSMRQRQWC